MRWLRGGGVRPFESGTFLFPVTLALRAMLVLAANVVVSIAVADALYCSALSVALVCSGFIFGYQAFAERNTKLGDDGR
jgi:hypothetical protein